MQKILVPTDFSEQARHAMDLAVQLARKANAEVKLLNVVEAPTASFSVMGEVSDSGDFDLYTLKLIQKTKKDMAVFADADQNRDVTINSAIEVGNAYKAISREITDLEVDMVIMGSQGASGWEEALIGSNAEKVVRRSKCPVLVVKDHIDVDQINNIVFAASFLEEGSQVLAKIKNMQELLGAKLHLLRVNTPGNFSPDRKTKPIMGQWAEEHDLKDYTINICNDLTEEDGIVHFSESINADLIALATHGRVGLEHLLAGSIAEDLVNHARRPVWTCKMD